MFTGIVEGRGRVTRREQLPEGTLLVVRAPGIAEDARPGDSVSVSGACLTVIARTADELSFDLTPETLVRTTLGALRPGDGVNLERPLTLAAPLGGHLVQGHVDGVGTVRRVDRNGGGAEMTVSVPESLRRYLVEKGSVAVDGVSLTVAQTAGETFRVALVPHTLAVTTLRDRGRGDRVNVEVDVVAKYLESLAGTGR